MAIRGRAYMFPQPLVRRLNLTLHKAGTAVPITATNTITASGQKNFAGTATITAANAITGTGLKGGQGTGLITATGTITGSGGEAKSGTATITVTGTITGSSMSDVDIDVRIGRPCVITFGPPF